MHPRVNNLTSSAEVERVEDSAERYYGAIVKPQYHNFGQEDNTELTQPQDKHSFQRDMQKKQEEEKATRLQKEIVEKTMAEEMRKSVTETISLKL